MSSIQKPEVFEYDRLKIVLQEGNGTFTVAWLGECDARRPDITLAEFLQVLLGRLQGRAIIVDFSKFAFMNSSTLFVILQFVRQLDKMANTQIVYDTKVEWQLVAYRCMKAISRTLKQTQVIGLNS